MHGKSLIKPTEGEKVDVSTSKRYVVVERKRPLSYTESSADRNSNFNDEMMTALKQENDQVINALNIDGKIGMKRNAKSNLRKREPLEYNCSICNLGKNAKKKSMLKYKKKKEIFSRRKNCPKGSGQTTW